MIKAHNKMTKIKMKAKKQNKKFQNQMNTKKAYINNTKMTLMHAYKQFRY